MRWTHSSLPSSAALKMVVTRCQFTTAVTLFLYTELVIFSQPQWITLSFSPHIKKQLSVAAVLRWASYRARWSQFVLPNVEQPFLSTRDFCICFGLCVRLTRRKRYSIDFVIDEKGISPNRAVQFILYAFFL